MKLLTNEWVHGVDIREVLQKVLCSFIGVPDTEGSDSGAGSIPNVTSQDAHTCIDLQMS